MSINTLNRERTYEPGYVLIDHDEQLDDLGWFPPADKEALLTELVEILEDLYARNRELFSRGMGHFFTTVSSHIRSSKGLTTRATMERVDDDLAEIADNVVSYFHRRVPEVVLASGKIDQNRQHQLAQNYAKMLFEEIIRQKVHLFSKFFTANVTVPIGKLAQPATGQMSPREYDHLEIPFD